MRQEVYHFTIELSDARVIILAPVILARKLDHINYRNGTPAPNSDLAARDVRVDFSPSFVSFVGRSVRYRCDIGTAREKANEEDAHLP